MHSSATLGLLPVMIAAEPLKVRAIPKAFRVTVVRTDVVNLCRHLDEALGSTGHAERVGTQHQSPEPLPAGRVVQLTDGFVGALAVLHALTLEAGACPLHHMATRTEASRGSGHYGTSASSSRYSQSPSCR